MATPGTDLHGEASNNNDDNHDSDNQVIISHILSRIMEPSHFVEF